MLSTFPKFQRCDLSECDVGSFLGFMSHLGCVLILCKKMKNDAFKSGKQISSVLVSGNYAERKCYNPV